MEYGTVPIACCGAGLLHANNKSMQETKMQTFLNVEEDYLLQNYIIPDKVPYPQEM